MAVGLQRPPKGAREEPKSLLEPSALRARDPVPLDLQPPAAKEPQIHSELIRSAHLPEQTDERQIREHVKY